MKKIAKNIRIAGKFITWYVPPDLLKRLEPLLDRSGDLSHLVKSLLSNAFKISLTRQQDILEALIATGKDISIAISDTLEEFLNENQVCQSCKGTGFSKN